MSPTPGTPPPDPGGPCLFPDGALARRIERAWAWTTELSARAAARAPGAPPGLAWESFGPTAGAASFGVGSPLSQAQGLGFGADGPEPVDAATLDRLDAFFDDRGLTPAVEVSTLADPGLLPALAARGYRPAEATHMLVRPIGPEDGATAANVGPSIAVVRVDPADAAQRAACAGAVLGGFFEGSDPPPGLADVFDQMTAAPEASAWYARLAPDLTPAGGAVLIEHDQLALFAGDATLPAARRRGVQTALIRARLAFAARSAATLAVACTQPGSPSQRNYQRLGFVVAYARILMTREARSTS